MCQELSAFTSFKQPYEVDTIIKPILWMSGQR